MITGEAVAAERAADVQSPERIPGTLEFLVAIDH